MSSLTWKPNDLHVAGTSLRGKVMASYETLVEVFGEPNIPAGDKVWNDWGIEFEVGNPDDDDWDVVDVTIYDWKEPDADVARRGKYMWHVGAKTHLGVELVYAALGDEILKRNEITWDEVQAKKSI